MARIRAYFAATITLGSLAILIGCGGPRPEPVTAQAFRPPPPSPTHDRETGRLDDRARIDLLQRPGEQTPDEPVTALSPTVTQTIQSPLDPSVRAPGVPTTSFAPGQYLMLGSVIVEVNGAPIYAHRVLDSLQGVLRARAQELDRQAFEKAAAAEIHRQVQLLINNELEYAVAYVNLSPEERRLAENLTTAYRQRLITLAGGSVERARRKAAEEGIDFDEKVREEYRTNVVRIYYQKRVLPRVQVSASDMRRFYERNMQRLFSTPDQARFRVIRIAKTSPATLQADRQKIEQLHQRAKAGEDFAELAGAFNDDPILLRNAGDVGLIDRGAYRVGEVEEAVWKLQPGQVTDIIETRDSFYIARLEQKNLGTTRPFEDQTVQMEILETLRREQFNALRTQEQEKLRRNAIIHPANPSIEPILEMAMQQYAAWRTQGT